MSAFILGKDHIDYLVTAAIDLGTNGWYGVYFTTWGVRCRVDITSCDTVGTMLIKENIASVQYRYHGESLDTLPGPIDKTELLDYEYHRFRPFDGHDIDTIAQVVKAVACYEYQACEHPEWEDSGAKRVCDAIVKGYIMRLPGYEDAQWEVEREGI
jgi:hypothetical protein